MDQRRRALGVVLLLCCVSCCAFVTLFSDASPAWPEASVDAGRGLGTDDGMMRVIVQLQDRNLTGVPKTEVLQALKSQAADSQGPLLAFLAGQQELGNARAVRPLYIVDAVALEATPDLVATLATFPGVAEVVEDRTIQIPLPIPSSPMAGAFPMYDSEWNIALVRAPEVWALGMYGADVVVGLIDTGCDYTHPDVATKWRGYPSSPVGNWVDCVNGYSMPYDDYGHGTHTTGTILGGNAGGTNIGVAPQAKWIHAKAFDSGGSGQSSWILAAMQWMLDPNGDGDPLDAPDVVSNSWGGYGMDDIFRAATQAWRAAGIFPSFSIGNAGPGSGTTGHPGNYPESFAAGATDSSDTIADFSSRGPSPYDEEPPDGTYDIKPDVSAPGVSVKSSVPGGGYAYYSGTSMACPHVTGLVALLRQARPAATVDELEARIRESVVDLGAPGPDNDYGWGRIDCLAAAEPWLGTEVRGTASCLVDSFGVYDAEIVAINLDSGAVRTTHTNRLGEYVLHLQDGSWRMYAALDGWEPFTPTARDVTVPPEAGGVDFASRPVANGAISGQVTAASALEVSVESAHPYPSTGWYEYRVSGPIGADTVKAHFSQIQVAECQSWVHIFDHWGNYVTSYRDWMTDVWTPEVAGPDMTVVLESYCNSGYWGFALDKIQAGAASGVSDVLVSLAPGSASTITGSDGTYLLSGVCPHSYMVTPSKPGIDYFVPAYLTADVMYGAECSGIDFEVITIPAQVEGRAVCANDGFGIAGAAISFTNLDTGAMGTVYTDEQGNYSTYLTDGAWRVTASKDGWAGFTPASMDIVVPPGVSGLDFSSAPNASASISGRVTTLVREEISAESAHPYPGPASVEYPIAGPLNAIRIRVHFPYLELGECRASITIYDNSGNVVTSYSGHYTDVWTPEFDGPGASIVLNSTCNNGHWGFAADMVEATTGEGEPGVTLSLAPGEASAVTGADGTYSIGDVCPHVYTATPTCDEGNEFVPAGRQVALDPGWEQTDVDFQEVRTMYPIEGRITGYDGQPMDEVTVLLTPAAGGDRQRTATDTDGRFRFGALAGTYQVSPASAGVEFIPNARAAMVGPGSTGNDFSGVSLLDNQALITLWHTYLPALSVSVGVGDPQNPMWSKLVQPSYTGSAARAESMYVPQEYAYWVVGIGDGSGYLPPSSANRWHAKVADVDEFGDTGELLQFVVKHGGTYYYELRETVQDDFEAYPLLSELNGRGGWISGDTLGDDRNGWVVTDDGSSPAKHIRFWPSPWSEFTHDSNWAIMRHSSTEPITDLVLRLSYFVQYNGDLKVWLSGDGVTWQDVTGELGLVKSAGPPFQQAKADLSSHIGFAGISNDVYLKFTAEGTSGENWVSALDSLALDINGSPAPIVDNDFTCLFLPESDTALYPQVVINSGASTTSNPEVALRLYAWLAREMRLQVDAGGWGDWIPYSRSASATLPAVQGSHLVSAQFRRSSVGPVSATVSDSIMLDLNPVCSITLTGEHGYVIVDGVAHVLPWSGSAPCGSTVCLEAIADPFYAYEFSGWSGGLGGSVNPQCVAVNDDLEIGAAFAPIPYSLTVDSSGCGSVSLSPGNGPRTVVLTASPCDCWQFAGWTGDLGGSANPTEVVLNQDWHITASFAQREHTLTVTADPPGGGGVTGAGIYTCGQTVPVTARPEPGYRFANWSGPVADRTSASTTVVVDGDLAVTAHFVSTECAVMEAVSAEGAAGEVARVPMVLQLGSTLTADRFAFSVAVAPAGGSPALDAPLSFEAAPGLPAPGMINAGQGEISVAWLTPLPEPLAGTVVIGDILVPVPAQAAAEDVYTACMVSVGASLGPAEICANAGPCAQLTVCSQVLVGDAYPSLDDLNQDGDGCDFGEFGDDNLSWGDVITVFDAWAAPGSFPCESGTDRLCAMDSYPRDTDEVAGGDGALTWGDIITTFDRWADPELSRPWRPLCQCVSEQPQATQSKASAGRGRAEVSAEAPVLEVADGSGQAGSVVRLPVLLDLKGALADRVAFAAELVAADGTSLQADLVGFAAAEGLSDPLVATTADGGMAVAWLAPMERPLSGAIALGELVVELPAEAAPGHAWWVRLAAVGAAVGDQELSPAAAAGEDALVTVAPRIPHDGRIASFEAPKNAKVGSTERLSVRVENLTGTPETARLVLRRDGEIAQSLSLNLGSREHTTVKLVYTFRQEDSPRVELTAELLLAGDEHPENNSVSHTVKVR